MFYGNEYYAGWGTLLPSIIKPKSVDEALMDWRISPLPNIIKEKACKSTFQAMANWPGHMVGYKGNGNLAIKGAWPYGNHYGNLRGAVKMDVSVPIRRTLPCSEDNWN